MDTKTRIEHHRTAVERHLEKVLAGGGRARLLEEAMRYAVFPGGKRIRPLLVLAAGELLGLESAALLPAACGIELIHNFSLIHDDLPCMDDDDTRRGRPTCHRKFDEATALLAGDALLCLGLEEIARVGSAGAVALAAHALGADGMAGGQSLDILLTGKKAPAAVQRWIDRKKTGELFSLCFEIPALVAGAPAARRKALQTMGMRFGEAFQALDDLHDASGDRRARQREFLALRRDILAMLARFGAAAALLEALVLGTFAAFPGARR
jgi:geranylgeranyl diphosphate synthase, type II